TRGCSCPDTALTSRRCNAPFSSALLNSLGEGVFGLLLLELDGLPLIGCVSSTCDLRLRLTIGCGDVLLTLIGRDSLHRPKGGLRYSNEQKRVTHAGSSRTE